MPYLDVFWWPWVVVADWLVAVAIFIVAAVWLMRDLGHD
jgi:hypothetical protein